MIQISLREIGQEGHVVHGTTPIVLEAGEVRELSHDIFNCYRTKVNPKARELGRPRREANADSFPIVAGGSTLAQIHFVYDAEETHLSLECQDSFEASKVFRLWREQRAVAVDLEYIREHVRGSLAEIVAAVLWQLGAIKVSLGDLRPLFVVDEGKNRSPIYIDVKLLPNYPVANDFVLSQAALLLRNVEFDALCGIEAGSIAFAASLAQKLARPMFFARRSRKFPEAQLLEGIRAHEIFRRRVVLVDDTIVNGQTKARVISALRDQGAEVRECLVIFDREQGGRESMARLGVQLRALTSRTAAMSKAIPRAITFLTSQELDEVRAYFRDPHEWHRHQGLPYHPQ
ncbi:MAG: phosphoribosyltransferase family protein [candidate division WOR-3 bacterium]